MFFTRYKNARKNKMNVSMKTMIPTAMLALSAMAVSSCGSEGKNKKQLINFLQKKTQI